MNPTKQEAQLHALNGALDRLAFYVADNATRTSDVRQIRMLLTALAPAIAPGGDAIRAAMQIAGTFGACPVPAAGNAGAVDDAMVERAKKAYCDWFGPIGEGVNTLALRAALTAALAPAAPHWGNVPDLDVDEDAPAAASGGQDSIVLDAYQLRSAAEFAAPDYEQDASQRETELIFKAMPERVVDGETMPAGMYCWYAEYPEEGALYLEEWEEYVKRLGPLTQAFATEATRPDAEDVSVIGANLSTPPADPPAAGDDTPLIELIQDMTGCADRDAVITAAAVLRLLAAQEAARG